MIWLAMDTSTTTLAVAVMRDGEVLAAMHDRAERNHSIRLVPAIEQLLADAGVAKADIGAIACGRGPGSYTGVRIAATVAKTYAWALGVPLYGVSSLAALALSAVLERGADAAQVGDGLVPVMNARRGQAYTALYEVARTDAGAWTVDGVEPDGNRLAAEWFAAMPHERAWRVVGETDAFVDALQAAGDEVAAAAHYVDMRADAIGLLAQARLARGEAADDVHSFVPNYTQLAEAEVKWLANQSPESR